MNSAEQLVESNDLNDPRCCVNATESEDKMIYFYQDLVDTALSLKDDADCVDVATDLKRIECAINEVQQFGTVDSAQALDQ